MPYSHKRSKQKLVERREKFKQFTEEKLARQYVYKHSISACRNNNPDEIRERIFTGTPEDLKGAVLAEVKDKRQGGIPDFPQGLVVGDSRGTGYFDLHF